MTVADAEFTVVSLPGEADYVIKARGEIDLHTGEQLRTVLRDGLATGPARLVVDIAEVTFVDSSGLGVLVGAFKRAQDRGTDLVLRAPSTRVVRILELTGLLHVLPILPDRDAADAADAGDAGEEPPPP